MSSPPPTILARSYYGTVNPSILGGFEAEFGDLSHKTEDEDLIDLSDPPPSTPEPTVVIAQAPVDALQNRYPAFQYRATSSLILDGFGDSDDDAPADADVATAAIAVGTPVPQGYRPTSSSILAGFDSDEDDSGKQPAQAAKPALFSSLEVQPTPGTSQSRNPYGSVIESRHNAMTVAFFRSQDSITPVGELPVYPDEEFGFGQRYKQAPDTLGVVVTQQRIPVQVLSGSQECIVCTDTLSVAKFPAVSITKSCEHPPTACLVCIADSIKSDLSNRLWNEILCPECPAVLEYDDVQRYADPVTQERYQALSLRRAVSESDNFVWCTSGCGYGQCHDGDSAQPIVTCLLCSRRSCFRHNVAWHENLSCEEYDQLQEDPENFRSRFELDNEEAEEAASLRRVQEDADRIFAQSLMAEEQQHLERERIEREERDRVAREARDRLEREEQRREAEEMRRRIAQRKRDEEQSQITVSQTSRPCPGCGWSIEKNDGCSHMTCIKCKHEFCFECSASHRLIIERDNTAHQPHCQFHPNNMKALDLGYQEYYAD